MTQNREELISLIKSRALNIFSTHQLFCSETVLSVLNRGLSGDLPPELAIRLCSGLSEGLGGSGCLCGAVNGGVLALGLFLGRSTPGFSNAKTVMAASKEFHTCFQKRFGSSCCRVLTRKVKEIPKSHFQHCTAMTGFAAQTAARIILTRRPELVEQADWTYLSRQDSKLKGGLKKLTGLIS